MSVRVCVLRQATLGLTWTHDLKSHGYTGMSKQTKNRMGRCMSNMLKWKYSDADTICDYGEQSQTMNHLLKCPMLPQECTTEDLMDYNEAAKEYVFQWMSNV